MCEDLDDEFHNLVSVVAAALRQTLVNCLLTHLLNVATRKKVTAISPAVDFLCAAPAEYAHFCTEYLDAAAQKI